MGGTTIYALCEPMTGEVRYVGKTTGPLKHRLAKHLACKVNRPVASWARKRARSGAAPQIVAIDFAHEDWAAREAWWIQRYRHGPGRLLNLTDGGDGAPGWRASPEQRARMSAANSARRDTDETRAKKSAGQKARLLDPAYRKRLVDGVRRACSDPEFLERRKLAITAAVQKSEYREAMSDKLSGRVITWGAKISAAKMGHTVSAETRLKISISLKNRALERANAAV